MAINVVATDGTAYVIEDADAFDVRDGFCVAQDAAGRAIAAFPAPAVAYVERPGSVRRGSAAPPQQGRSTPEEALARYVD